MTPQPKVKSSLNANIAMTFAVGHLKAMSHTGVHSILTGKVNWLASPQNCILKLCHWAVRTVMLLAMALKSVEIKSAVYGLFAWSLLMPVHCPIIFFCLFSIGECSYLESLLSMTQMHLDPSDQQRAVDAQWQFTQQTYGLHRPSRDGLLQIFRAVNSYIGPGNPAVFFQFQYPCKTLLTLF